MTAKIYGNPKFPHEYEITIEEDFEIGRAFLKATGLFEKAYQETYREMW